MSVSLQDDQNKIVLLFVFDGHMRRSHYACGAVVDLKTLQQSRCMLSVFFLARKAHA